MLNNMRTLALQRAQNEMPASVREAKYETGLI